MSRLDKVVAFVAVALFPTLGYGAPPTLEMLGLPWKAEGKKIEWQASTEQLPTSASVYLVTNTAISSETMSNLLALTSFTEKDCRACPGELGAILRAHGEPPHDLDYNDASERRFLTISPNGCYVRFLDHQAGEAPNFPNVDVPERSEVLSMAEKILPRIGISTNDLYHDRESGSLAFSPEGNSITRFDKSTGQFTTRTTARGVFLPRCYDGIPSIGMGGGGGVGLKYGNHSQLYQLDVVWRGIKPGPRYPVATKDQLMARLKAGECVCRSYRGDDIQSIVVKKVRPFYLELQKWVPQTEIHPIAQIVADVQLSNSTATNQPFLFYCPLLVYPEGSTKSEEQTE